MKEYTLNYPKTILLLLFALAMVIPASAQKRENKNYVLLRDTITGKDSALHGGIFLPSTNKERQYAIRWIKGDTIRALTSKEVVGYRESNVTYETKLIPTGGGARLAMVPRHARNSVFTFYLFINDKGEKEYYFQKADDGSNLLTSMRGDSTTIHYENTLTTYLKSFPIAKKSEEVRNYIRTMPPTLSGFISRYRVVTTRNLNYIPRRRWGIMAGVGTFKPHTILLTEFSAQVQPHIGAFFNLPLIFDLSLQLELSYRRFAFSKIFDSLVYSSDAVYNRHDLIPGIFARYSFNSLRGKWIPYLQVGFEPKIVVSGNADNQSQNAQLIGGQWYFDSWTDSSHPIKNPISTISGGAGVEYKLSFRHSLFFDIRYSYESADEGINGFYTSLSYNF
ncbi:MAG: PorT family protein [Prevotellaceae bacterium]|jgi:hypothetical protein|nr:PorT family protein [Prevotellaceae bacterium]